MEIMSKVSELLEDAICCLEDARKDAGKFEHKNNASAGVRVRKIAQVVRSLLKDLRAEIQQVKDERSKD
jgi:hypothetical protein